MPIIQAEPGDRLTPREKQVLEQVARGLSNKQIADVLDVSESTVHYHVSNICVKLRAPNRTMAAVTYALGLACPGCRANMRVLSG